MAPATAEAFDALIEQRKREADEFYAEKLNSTLSVDQQRVVRQAYAGLLWSKQFYQYIVADWLTMSTTQSLSKAP